MTINELIPAIKLENHHDFSVNMKLTANGGSDKYLLDLGNIDIWVYGVSVEILNADGKLLSNNEIARDDFRISIKHDVGDGFMLNPISLSAYSDMSNFSRFQGWYFDHNKKYTFELTGQADINKAAYPVTVNLNFLGYKI
jgi:hypothetical protein